MNRRTCVFLLPIFLFTLMIPVAYTTNDAQVEVNPLSCETLTFNMSYGQIFAGILWNCNTYEKSIDFWVTSPEGTTILNLGRVSQKNKRFEFGAFQDGIYTLHFDNSFSSQITKK